MRTNGRRIATRHGPEFVADTLALTALALLVAAPGIGSPPVLVFDEVAYVGDAVSLLEHGVATGFRAHPPAGSWLLSAGIALVGPTSVGWRLVPLVLGVLAVPLLHRLALATSDGPARRWVALGAAALLLLDGSWLVLTRTAMLDGMLTTLVLAAVTAAVAARRRRAGGRAAWGMLATSGALLGLATATKWSGALAALVVLVVLAGHRRSASGRRSVPWTALATVAVTAGLVYGATWVPFALHRGDTPFGTCPVEAAPCVTQGGLAGVAEQHRALVRFHRAAAIDSGYESDPAQWLVSYRPVPLWRSTCDVPAAPPRDPFAVESSCPPSAVEGEDAIVYFGNPVTWLLFALLLPLSVRLARRGEADARLAVAAWFVLWAPWMLVSRDAFLFYLAPAVPFMALGVATTVARLPAVRPLRPVAAGAGSAIVGLLLSLAGLPLGTAVLGWAGGGLLPTAADPPATDGRRATALVLLTVVGAAAMHLVARPFWVA